VNYPSKHIHFKEESLVGKSALVTGASRGIGRAIALGLAARGARLAICARQELPLQSVKEEIENLGTTCCIMACDLAREDEIRRQFRSVLEALGKVDVLINNAGIIKAHSTDETPDNGWQETLRVNLGAAMTLSELALQSMRSSGWGRIVNISSISGTIGEAFAAAYAASKAALNGATAASALQAARYGVTVNAICPGWVDTELARQQLSDEHWCKLSGISPDDSFEIARLSCPQERFIEPEEIGELVAFICSERAKSITGQMITVCGGLSLL
jgi:NAD(P)-dependent dehydrogenase (short-subunit alcohol dehydrogenase family)